MSIASAIELKQQQVAQAYTAVSDKGGTLPSVKNLENLPAAINSISAGSIVTTTATFTENGVYNASLYQANGFSEVTVDVQETEPYLISMTITQNGTYLPLEYDADGFSDIEVNVPPEAVIINTTITQNGTYNAQDESASGYGSVKVAVPYVPREISSTGVYQMQTSSPSYILPTGVVDLGDNVLRCAFMGSSTQIFIFNGLESVSGDNALNMAFADCSNFVSASFEELQSITGNHAFDSAFSGCDNTAFTSMTFSVLENITGEKALTEAFEDCTSLTSISFPALTTTSFGSNTDQFNNMLSGVDGCTVHFPQSIENTIGTWADVLDGFGGTNTNVLFDLVEEP